MKKVKLKGYIIEKSREGVKTLYLSTPQYFVDDIYQARIYKDKKDAEKDMNIASFNHDIYTWMLHEPKYTFKIISI